VLLQLPDGLSHQQGAEQCGQVWPAFCCPTTSGCHLLVVQRARLVPRRNYSSKGSEALLQACWRRHEQRRTGQQERNGSIRGALYSLG
jgi:hypothetical protein